MHIELQDLSPAAPFPRVELLRKLFFFLDDRIMQQFVNQEKEEPPNPISSSVSSKPKSYEDR